MIAITRQAGPNAVLNGVFLDGAQSSAALYQLGAGASVDAEADLKSVDGLGGDRPGDRAADLRSLQRQARSM